MTHDPFNEKELGEWKQEEPIEAEVVPPLNLQESKDKQEEKPKQTSMVSISDQGALDFSNQVQLGTCARLAITMQLAPKGLIEKGIPAVMAALICCKQFNLPATAMNEMAYVEGKLTFFGSLMTALAQRDPEWGEKEEFFIDIAGKKICYENENYATSQPWASVIRIKKKSSDVWNEYIFSVSDAEQAGLLTNQTKAGSGWKKYTKDLLYHKAKNRALKSNFAGALNGALYHEDIEADFKTMYKKSELQTAEDLNQEAAV